MLVSGPEAGISRSHPATPSSRAALRRPARRGVEPCRARLSGGWRCSRVGAERSGPERGAERGAGGGAGEASKLGVSAAAPLGQAARLILACCSGAAAGCCDPKSSSQVFGRDRPFPAAFRERSDPAGSQTNSRLCAFCSDTRESQLTAERARRGAPLHSVPRCALCPH